MIAPAPVSASGETPFRRLHPTTLLQGFLRSLPGYVILLLPVLRGGGGPGARLALVFALLFAVLTLPGLVLGYLRFRYRLTEDEVEIESGVFSRRHRSIPYDRIQRVEVDRPLLPRLFGTARVRLMTGSGHGAEGTLEYVSVEEALALRAAIRRLQTQGAPAPVERAEAASDEVPELETPEPEAALHFALTPGLLLRAGAMRFSLIYIALAFSALQFTGFTVEDIVWWIERENVLERVPLLSASPMLALAVSVGLALVLSWVAGVITTVFRYHRFALRADERRFYTERGLAGRFERALPRDKVQAVLYTSNPITRRFGYARLEVQTMGLDNAGSGHEVLVPLERVGAVSALGESLLGHARTTALRPVSRLFIRRRGLRYSVTTVVLLGVAALFWREALWGLLALPLVWVLAWAQWRAHGYAFDGQTLVVQHGALWRRQWHLPLTKFQTVDRWATLFQTRLGLASVYVDTAGAPATREPIIEDLPVEDAHRLAETLYARFEGHYGRRQRVESPV